MHENEISGLIIKYSIDIHKEYGPGLLESFYEDLLCNKLSSHGLKVEKQKSIEIIDSGISKSKTFRIDILVEEKVIVEVKSTRGFADVHKSQILTYLKITKLKLGLLINFNKPRLVEGIKRVVNNL